MMIRVLGTGPSNFPRSALELVTKGGRKSESEKERLHWTTLTPELLLSELTRPRRFTRRAPFVRDAYAPVSRCPFLQDAITMTINDDTTRHRWLARGTVWPRSCSRKERRRETGERERTLPSRGRGKNCAAKARLVSRRFPADVTISCIDWPGREPSRD